MSDDPYMDAPRNDADLMVDYLRALPPAQLHLDLVDHLSDREVKHWMNQVPDRVLDVWWRAATGRPSEPTQER